MNISSINKLLKRWWNVNFNTSKIPSQYYEYYNEGLKPFDDIIKDTQDKKIITRICKAYNFACSQQNSIPSAYQIGSKWKPQIIKQRHEYIKYLNTSDISALQELFHNFFRNSGSVSILKNHLFPTLSKAGLITQNIYRKEFISSIKHDIEVWKAYFNKTNLSELSIPVFGNPFGLYIDNTIITGSSCSLNYYAKKADALLFNVRKPVVAEIGGGFGGLLYYIRKNNPDTVCINFDIPEVLTIAQYFLMSAFPDKKFLLYGEPGSEGRISKQIISNFDMILLPNFKLPDLDDLSIDLFLNTHSFSEMEEPTIAEYLAQITRATKSFFYHENSTSAHNIGYGALEVPASNFPISPEKFSLIYKTKAIWGEPRYMEYLYWKKP